MKKAGEKNKISVTVTANVIIAVVLIAICLASAGGATQAATAWDQAVYRGNEDKPEVSLMFNVYWGTEYISGILETLRAYGAKATFFVGGSWAAKNAATLVAIASDGHEIGSHGYNHRDADKLDYKQNADEITVTHKLVKELAGVEMNLFAPPSGAIGKEMFRAASDNGYRVIMWSRDTIDWRDKNADLVYKRATDGIRNGELILMHPTEHTLKALPEVLKFFKENGYTAVTVTSCIAPSEA